MEIEGRNKLEVVNGSLKLGPWMHGPRRGRRRPNKETAIEVRSLYSKSATNSGVSRFEILEDLDDHGNSLLNENK